MSKQGQDGTDAIVADLLGRLVEFWGFRSNLGRIWALLYLAPEPLGASELQERLELSTGAVSMALSDLQHWGVVRKRDVSGVRRDLFEAEPDLWRNISRVLRSREWSELDAARDALARAEGSLPAPGPGVDPRQLVRAHRIRELHNLLVSFQDGLALVLASEHPDELFDLLGDDPL